MAWTVTRTPTVFGNLRAAVIKVTTDAATANLDTGLSRITGFAFAPASMGTIVGLRMAPNSGVAGTAIGGILGCSGFTSGDDFYLTVFGT
jgi:hypothetical protein